MEPGRNDPVENSMNIAVIGNYVPRQCGLATFTTDVAQWLERVLPAGSEVFVVAMNDREEGYNYPPMVHFGVLANNPRAYPRAADFINLSGVDLVCLQHEFGIFGGPRGIYVADMLRDLKKPVVTTLHTVLPEPDEQRRRALAEVAELSDALVVMSRKCIDFLDEYYGVPREKIHVIHHGVPEPPSGTREEHKARWGLSGRTVLLTFGLLHSGKGVEYMVEAMPSIVERYPDVVYVVLGATHPPVKKREGEKYRYGLKARARELGVEDNVVFYDRFVPLEELTSFMAACDIYVTPYLDMNQVVSGTLAYAMGLGRPVVSTPYYYAQELLGEGTGVLVPVRDSGALSEAVLDLLADPVKREAMGGRAYELGRNMVWDRVAGEYLDLFATVLAGRRVAPLVAPKRMAMALRDLPRPKLDYLARLTDAAGALHRSHFDIPDRASGYTTEDNALALAAVVLCHMQTEDPRALELARTYLGMLRYMQREDGLFHNVMHYDRSFGDEVGSQECQGKALLGLGLMVALGQEEGLVSFAKGIFDDALESISLTAPRAVSQAAIGSYHYLTRFAGASLASSFLDFAGASLVASFDAASAPGWEWFEDTLYYANGLMPRALLLAYRATREGRYKEVALAGLEFLVQTCCPKGTFDLVGDQGWYARGGGRARFNQLPIEATSLVEVLVDAYVVEGSERYMELARLAFEWYLGRNAVGEPLYDFASFSCADSIMVHGLDENRSTEATVQWLLALLRIQTALHLEPVSAAGNGR
ncbi:MAG: glycosyltransferase [Actinobacteria bacterium]|nr:glycosyltransferase [Actinomycetota bacterium]MBU1944840.1 glycosyltransferase [Actinomycetota bacterium]MBU2687093.1 glycosyltransferase [Actinomycetota bacterium]